MKKLLRYLLTISVFLIIISCDQNTGTTTSTESVEMPDPLEGVWQMTHYYRTWGGDTVYSGDTATFKRIQHKIYLDGYVMWNMNPAEDSTEWHGFGTYRLSNDTVIEKLLTTSIPMMANWENWENDSAILKVEYDINNFKQVIASVYNDTIFQQIEVYKKVLE